MGIGKEFGERFKNARESKDLTQKDVARKIGKHYHRVIAYEAGRVTLDMAAKMAAAIDEPLQRLLFPEGITKPNPSHAQLTEKISQITDEGQLRTLEILVDGFLAAKSQNLVRTTPKNQPDKKP